MKKHILVCTVFMIMLNSIAQVNAKKSRTIEIQAKGSLNSTWLFNKNIGDQGESQNYDPGWGWNYGLGGTMYFGNVGFTIEALLGNHHGNYEGTVEFFNPNGVLAAAVAYESNVNLKLFELPVLLKFRNQYGTYLELGIQYNSISSATYEISTTANTMDSTVTSAYANDYFSAVLGFGWQYQFGESDWAILGGLRLVSSFTNLEGVDALGRSFDNTTYYSDPEKTTAFAGGIMLGVVYSINRK